jgi:hypothetical protein
MRYLQHAVLILITVFATNTFAGYEEDIAAMSNGMPEPVKKVIDRQIACNHWAGEEPYDAERATDINAALASLKCNSLARDEAKLIKKYKSRADVKDAINQAKNYF